MSHHSTVKILDLCQVGPPPASLPSTTLPLTFFDLPWLHCRPAKRIFFYHFPHPTHHFLQTTLPILKHSLSLTFQHFFPFAGNLIIPPQPHHHVPYIRYLPGDSVSFTVAESTADFNLLISDSPQDVRNWHPLVPTLPSPRTDDDGTRVIPLMAIQVTILPCYGLSICATFSHVAADGKSLHHFMKYWASVSKANGDLTPLEGTLSLPFHDRDRVKDPKGLKLVYLRESMKFEGFVRDVYTNKVRATFVLSHERVEKVKKWISLKCASSYASGTPHVSTFVVTCSLVWVCMIKSEQRNVNCVAKGCDELCYMVFVADCRDSPEFALPSTYFGNCLASLIPAVKRGEIVGENGIVVAANAIGRKIRDFKSDAMGGAETLMSDFRELGKPGKSVLVVAGSPKLGVYETDFGWGNPKKSEAVHLD
ncbi:Transferase [Sesbania bispinosa]|nr:Transferase [Sesbania bispinosa]